MKRIFAFVLSVFLISPAFGQSTQGSSPRLPPMNSVEQLRLASKTLGFIILCPQTNETLTYCSALIDVFRKNGLVATYIPDSWVSEYQGTDKALIFACGFGGNREYPLTSTEEAVAVRDTVYAVNRSLQARDDRPCDVTNSAASEELFNRVQLWRSLGHDIQSLQERMDEMCRRPVRPTQCDNR